MPMMYRKQEASMNTILVIGGTGRIARPVVRELVGAGYAVRVMTRKPPSANGGLPNGIEWQVGDIQDKSALRDAMRGVGAVYINLPESPNPNAPFIPEFHGVQHIIETAPKNTLLIKLSQLNARELPHYHNLTFKARAEALIQASGFPYIIFRPTWFMESLPLILTQGKSVMYAGAQPIPLYWVAGADLGRQVVSAIRQRETVSNQILNVQGLEAFTFAQATRRYADAMGLRVSQLPLWTLRLAGLFSPQMKADYQVLAHVNREPEPFISQKTWDSLGKPQITLDKFISDWKNGAS